MGLVVDCIWRIEREELKRVRFFSLGVDEDGVIRSRR